MHSSIIIKYFNKQCQQRTTIKIIIHNLLSSFSILADVSMSIIHVKVCIITDVTQALILKRDTAHCIVIDILYATRFIEDQTLKTSF